ncbi:MAG: hypothetical protein ACRDSJ_04640 [Rubrobacteraceae bacterium]
MKVETLDLDFLGREEVIASYLLLGDDSAALARRDGSDNAPG